MKIDGEEVTEEWAERKCRQYGVPVGMAGGLYRYLVHSIPPGSFLTAVLNNDFADAVSRADLQNSLCLREWAQFLCSELPSNCWGNVATVRQWLSKREVS